MKHYHRSDANTGLIVRAFEKLGWLVHRTNSSWDLTVTKAKKVMLIEVRDPNAPDQKRRNKGDDLVDLGWPIRRCKTLEDVLAIDKAMFG